MKPIQFKAIAAFVLMFLLGTIKAHSLLGQVSSAKGVPFLKNYSPNDYHHFGKIWSIDSAPNGIVYMASDKGVLEYDGFVWRGFKGSKGITRSIYVINDSLFYSGSDRNFGVWKRNDIGGFDYESLYTFREELTEINEEFWRIHPIGDYVAFVSSYNIYLLNKNVLTKIPIASKVQFSFVHEGKIHFTDYESNLWVLDGLTPQIVARLPISGSEIVGAFTNSDRELILVSKDQGLFRAKNKTIDPYQNQLSSILKEASIFSVETINNTIAFGSVLKGLLISDLNGNILHSINKNKGLPNNTILSLHYGTTGKLWFGMDYGVSFLDLTSEITYFYDFQGKYGTGYAAELQKNRFYLGTNQGLYTSDWESLNNSRESYSYDLIPTLNGQVWSLTNFDDKIWVSHDRGLFLVDGKQVESVAPEIGVLTIQPYKNVVLAGTYNGIEVIEKKAGKWKKTRNLDLILGSCNQLICEGENVLWVNLPNFGIIRAELDENAFLKSRKIYPSENFGGDEHLILDENQKIQVVTEKHIYKYSHSDSSFIALPNNLPIPKVENLLPMTYKASDLDSNFSFFPIYNGFAFKKVTDKDVLEAPQNVLFRGMVAFNNDTSLSANPNNKIPFELNNITINTIVPNQSNAKYQVLLDDNEWSDWTDKNSHTFINLGFGTHTISARADVDGVQTEISNLTISIARPWYHSFVAYIIYAIGIVMIGFILFLWQRNSIRKLKNRLISERQKSLQEQEKRHREQLNTIEQDHLHSEFEKLKGQLKSKTIELATRARENEDKNKALLSLKEKFDYLKTHPQELKNKLKEIQNILEAYTLEDDNTFEIQMDELHQEFFKILKSKYSSLSSNDLRLCAYLKLGFNSKEIADLLNIQPSSVYISRSRLRKKLDLDTSADLYGFLNSF